MLSFIMAPMLLLAREHDREALEYLATLLRQPQVAFPGADESNVDQQPAVSDHVVRDRRRRAGRA